MVDVPSVTVLMEKPNTAAAGVTSLALSVLALTSNARGPLQQGVSLLWPVKLSVPNVILLSTIYREPNARRLAAFPIVSSTSRPHSVFVVSLVTTRRNQTSARNRVL